MILHTLLTIFLSLLCVSSSWGDNIVHDSAKRLYLQTVRQPSGVVVPGERVRLFYKLYTPNFFTDAPFYQNLVVENGLIVEQKTLSASATFVGKQMASQIIEIDLYPSQDGIIEIPDLRFIGKVAGSGGEDVPPVALYSDPQVILVQTPVGLASHPGFVASTKVSVVDEWQIPSKHLEKGDLLYRTLTLRAKDVPPMILPDFVLNTPDGVSLLMTEPSLTTIQNRSENYSEIKQVATYSIDTAGTYHLGGEQIVWWKLGETPRVEVTPLGVKEIDAGGFALVWKLGVLLFALSLLVSLIYLGWRQIDQRKYRLARHLMQAEPKGFVGLAYRWAALYGDCKMVLREVDPRVGGLYRQLFSAKGEPVRHWKQLRRFLAKKIIGKR